jgi:hypothetical protein
METFSNYHEFVNTVGNGLLDLDPNQLDAASKVFKKITPSNHTVIYINAEASGRTKIAVEGGLSELPMERYVEFISSTTKDNPGRNIFETLKKIEERCDNIIILAASASGKKKTTNIESRRGINFIEESKKKNTDIVYLTGNPEGEIAQKFKEHGGIVVKVKGSEGIPEWEYKRAGFLGDASEAQMGYLTSEFAKIACGSTQNIYDNIRTHMKKVGSVFDSKESMTFIENLSNAFSRDTNNAILGISGGSLSVAEAARVRWDHFSKGYFKGRSTSEMGGDHHSDPPLPGNNFLAISQSGGNKKDWSGNEVPPVIPFYQMANERDTNNFCIVGEMGELTNMTPPGQYLLLSQKDCGNGYFPQDALLANTLASIKTMDKLISKGITEKYRPSVLKGAHHIG